jgi:hypothetical protein
MGQRYISHYDSDPLQNLSHFSPWIINPAFFQSVVSPKLSGIGFGTEFLEFPHRTILLVYWFKG